jgi:hypothetical protein
MNPLDDLRDIHLPPPPPWWPPAPGWWLLAALLLVAVLVLAVNLRRRRRVARERARLRAAITQVRAGHGAAPARLAAASELLRRACRVHAPHALALQGEAWLRFLDEGIDGAPFSTGPGRLLLDGPWRRDVDAAAVDAVLDLVEARLLLMPGVRT